MKARIGCAVIVVPACLVLALAWKLTCDSTLVSPLFSGDSLDYVDWGGPPRNFEGLVVANDLIVYGDVVSAEERDETFFPSTITTTRVRVIESFVGDQAPGNVIEISETAAPRPANRPAFLTCNYADDTYHVREASRAGDRRLWFLTRYDNPKDLINHMGPYGRLDIESDIVLVTTTIPRPLDLKDAPSNREEFLKALREATRRKDG